MLSRVENGESFITSGSAFISYAETASGLVQDGK